MTNPISERPSGPGRLDEGDLMALLTAYERLAGVLSRPAEVTRYQLQVVEEVVRLLRVDRATLSRTDPVDGTVLRVVAGIGPLAGLEGTVLPVEGSLEGRALGSAVPLRVPDLGGQAALYRSAEHRRNVGPAMAARIGEDRRIGVLLAARARGSAPFDEHDADLLRRFTHLVAVGFGAAEQYDAARGSREAVDEWREDQGIREWLACHHDLALARREVAFRVAASGRVDWGSTLQPILGIAEADWVTDLESLLARLREPDREAVTLAVRQIMAEDGATTISLACVVALPDGSRPRMRLNLWKRRGAAEVLGTLAEGAGLFHEEATPQGATESARPDPVGTDSSTDPAIETVPREGSHREPMVADAGKAPVRSAEAAGTPGRPSEPIGPAPLHTRADSSRRADPSPVRPAEGPSAPDAERAAREEPPRATDRWSGSGTAEEAAAEGESRRVEPAAPQPSVWSLAGIGGRTIVPEERGTVTERPVEGGAEEPAVKSAVRRAPEPSGAGAPVRASHGEVNRAAPASPEPAKEARPGAGVAGGHQAIAAGPRDIDGGTERSIAAPQPRSASGEATRPFVGTEGPTFQPDPAVASVALAEGHPLPAQPATEVKRASFPLLAETEIDALALAFAEREENERTPRLAERKGLDQVSAAPPAARSEEPRSATGTALARPVRTPAVAIVPTPGVPMVTATRISRRAVEIAADPTEATTVEIVNAPLTDFHCHLLPAVDDGASDLAEARAALATMYGHGVRQIVVSPHVPVSSLGRPYNERAARTMLDQSWAVLAEIAREQYSDLRLARGAELLLDEPHPDLSADWLRLAGTSFILIEFPGMWIPPHAVDALKSLVAAGYVPVIGHPERYQNARLDGEDTASWRGLGVRLQVNCGSLLGQFGPHARERAWSLLQKGAADYLSSDYHARGAYPVPDCRQVLEANEGAEQARLLLNVNPTRLLRDALPVPVPPLERQPSFLKRLGGKSLFRW